MARHKAKVGRPRRGDQAGQAKQEHAKSAEISLPTPCPEHLEVVELTTEDGRFALLSFPLPSEGLPRGLTEVEWLVAMLVLMGQSNASIAAERGVSARTVANQVASVFRKLGVSSRAELAAWVS